MSQLLDTVLPPVDPEALAEVESFLSDSERAAPSVLRGVLTHVREALAAGSAVRVERVAELLTTGEAADILNVSRTTMVNMLDAGKLPCERPNSHRLVRLVDVLAYKATRTQARKEFLDQMLRDSLEDGSFFHSYSDYAEAIDRARHSKEQ